MEKSKIMDMDSYIAACPVEIQKTLQKLRKTIQISAPEATEKMSYAYAYILSKWKPCALCSL